VAGTAMRRVMASAQDRVIVLHRAEFRFAENI
jgi:hypothetical protein